MIVIVLQHEKNFKQSVNIKQKHKKEICKIKIMCSNLRIKVSKLSLQQHPIAAQLLIHPHPSAHRLKTTRMSPRLTSSHLLLQDTRTFRTPLHLHLCLRVKSRLS